MRKSVTVLMLVILTSVAGLSATHTITNSGFTFSPANIVVNAGDTIIFQLDQVHTARQVTQATWNANGSASNGGFDLPNGGGTIVLSEPGVVYYVCVPHASLGMKGTITVLTPTDVDNEREIMPDNFILRQNYPNPFNPETTISFSLPANSFVSLKVFDNLGNEVAILVNEFLSAGEYSRHWKGEGLSSGSYFYRLEAGSFTRTKKLILLK